MSQGRRYSLDWDINVELRYKFGLRNKRQTGNTRVRLERQESGWKDKCQEEIKSE
jgi:hypothetical protein